MAVALGRVLAAEGQAPGSSCQMTMQALTSAGPSSGTAYSGVLEIAFGQDGAVDLGSLAFDGGPTVPVAGESRGRALSLRATFPDGSALVLTGTGEQALESCSGALSGVFGGPQLGDTGSWLIDPSQSQLLDDGGSDSQSSCADVSCVDPFVLDSGSCQCICQFDSVSCGGTCVAPCGPGETLDEASCTCVSGCGLSCPDGQSLDADACVCVDFCSDPAHPFYCGGECFGHEQTFCLGSCHDLLLHDPTQCGPDCVICPNGVPCLDGVCECPAGMTYCEVVGCKDLKTDSDNCGVCGFVCPVADSCADGYCTAI